MTRFAVLIVVLVLGCAYAASVGFVDALEGWLTATGIGG